MHIEVWQFLVGMVSILTAFGASVAWLVRLHSRQEGHEDVCERRYTEIANNFAQLVKVSDQRHEETRDALSTIDDKLTAMLTSGGRSRPH